MGRALALAAALFGVLFGATAADVPAQQPPSVWVEAASPGLEPGTPAQFVIKISAPAKKNTKVRVSTGPVEGPDAATAEVDYEPKDDEVVEIEQGERQTEVAVDVKDDALDEPREAFLFTLTEASGPGGLAIDPQRKNVVGGILDNDDPPAVKVANAPDVTEGDTGTAKAVFTVSVSKKTGRDVRVEYETENGTAKAGEDYTPKSGVLRIPAGDTTGTVSVDVTGDTRAEGDETFTLSLSRHDESATIGEPREATAKIVDDDKPEEPAPRLSIVDARVTEGDSGTTAVNLALRLSAKPSERVVVEVSTENGSAVAPSDYRAKTDTVTFDPGETTGVFTVLVNGDTVDEPDELFFAEATIKSGKAQIADGRASVAITDDDAAGGGGGPGPGPAATISIADVSADEPTAAPRTATFTVTVTPAVQRVVTVKWATADGTASAGSDYTAGSGTLTFAAGETTETVAVALLPDDKTESNESFFVNLSGPVGATLADAQGMATIVSKGAAPSLSITDVVARESEGAAFAVELTGTATSPVSVTFSTSDGTAREGLDYLGRRATLTFAPGEKTKTIAVTVVDDDLAEPVETFSVNLGNAVNAVITKSRGTATIESSDLVPTTFATPTGATSGVLPVTVKPSAPLGAKAKQVKAVLPRMALGPLVVTVDRRGVARMVVACKRVSPVTCAGRVALETAAKPKVTLSVKSFTVRKGKSASLPLKLRRPALRLLGREGKIRARVIVFVKVGKVFLRVVPGVITLQSRAATAASSSATP